MEVKISPIKKIKKEIEIPGDKSISHRAVILSGISKGITEVHNFLLCKDTLRTVKCMQMLGVKIKLKDTSLIIEGNNKLIEPKEVLNAGNSGTTARLLIGLLAAQDFFSIITGDTSLSQRPMDRVVLPLREMGASLNGRANCKYLPIAINGSQLHGINYTLKIPSAQVKSALLLAGLFAKGATSLNEPIPTRDHLERMIEFMGGKAERVNNTIYLKGGQILYGREIFVPSDISSASYFIALATMVPESEIIIKNVGINPTRTGFIDTLVAMGGNIQIFNNRIISNEPVADILVRTSNLKGIEIGGKDIPRLIDELPLLTVVATRAEGVTIVREAQELRVKESDRIKAIVSELSTLGAKIEELKDGFKVFGPCKLIGNVCHSYRDHRIAMALVIAGCIAKGKTFIKGAEWIDISFPGFLNIINNLAK